MARKEGVFSVDGNRPDGAFDSVVVDLDTTIGQEQVQAVPMFGDVFQGFGDQGVEYGSEFKRRFSDPGGQRGAIPWRL